MNIAPKQKEAETFPLSLPALQCVRAAFYKVLVNTSLTPTKE